MSEQCQRCGEFGEDRRTILMQCFYEMDELNIPFEKVIRYDTDSDSLVQISDGTRLNIPGGPSVLIQSPEFVTDQPLIPSKFYKLRVCKACRADWLQAIRVWFHDFMKKERCFSGLFVRINGENVEVTEEEYKRLKEEGQI